MIILYDSYKRILCIALYIRNKNKNSIVYNIKWVPKSIGVLAAFYPGPMLFGLHCITDVKMYNKTLGLSVPSYQRKCTKEVQISAKSAEV